MGSLVGAWMAVIGYALAYTGVQHFGGAPNASFLGSLGYGPTPAAQAAQAAQAAANPLNIIWNLIFNPLGNLVSGVQNITGNAQTSSAQTPSASSPGAFLA